eukprot:Transcript_14800.p2 GENE.Transcript_14800~~Transcript_14800.p2  ORF type:complete len:321 (+),score=163.28 Transcript_14800:865-1827(+)
MQSLFGASWAEEEEEEQQQQQAEQEEEEGDDDEAALAAGGKASAAAAPPIPFSESDAEAVDAVASTLNLFLLRWREAQPRPRSPPPAIGTSARLRPGAPPAGGAGAAAAPPRERRSPVPHGSSGTLATTATAPSALDAVLAISRDLGAAPSLRALLCTALRAADSLVRTQQATVYLTGEDDGSLLVVCTPQDEMGCKARGELDVLRLQGVGSGVAAHVLATGTPAKVETADTDKRFNAKIDRAPGYVVHSLICAPVLSAAGKPIAAVTLVNKVSERWQPGQRAEPRPFDADDERCLALLCSLLGPALERQHIKDDEFYRQ